MKLILRTLLIIAAGLLVTGALLAFGQSSYAVQMRETGSRGGRFEGRDGPFAGFEGRPEGRPEGGFEGRPEGRPGGFEGRGDHHGASIFGLGEVLKNLIKISFVIAIVVFGARLLRLERKDPPRPASPGTPTGV